MSAIHGDLLNGVPVKIVGASGNISTLGVAELEETYVCLWANVLQAIPVPYTVHPLFPYLQAGATKFKQRESAVAGEFTVTWSGLQSDKAPAVDPTFSFQGTNCSAPIGTHPNIDDLVTAAGGVSKGKAIANSDGVITGFGKDATGDLAGVESWEYEGAVWSISTVSNSRPTGLQNFGKIDEPQGGAPSFAAPRNWRLTGFSFTRKGAIYQLTKGWTLSGPRGWNNLLYGAGTPG